MYEKKRLPKYFTVNLTENDTSDIFLYLTSNLENSSRSYSEEFEWVKFILKHFKLFNLLPFIMTNLSSKMKSFFVKRVLIDYY